MPGRERFPRPAAWLGGALLLAGTPALAQDAPGGQWAVQPDAGGATAFVAGLSASCLAGGREVTLRPQASVAAGEESGLVEVVFEVDRDAFRRDGRLVRDQAGGLAPEVVIERNDILLAALSAGKTLDVALGPTRVDVPLRGSAEALRRLRAVCEGGAVPAAEASPAAPLQPGVTIQPTAPTQPASPTAPDTPLTSQPEIIIDEPLD